MGKWWINAEVDSTNGNQRFLVDGVDEKEAIKNFEAGKAEYSSEEIEICSLGHADAEPAPDDAIPEAQEEELRKERDASRVAALLAAAKETVAHNAEFHGIQHCITCRMNLDALRSAIRAMEEQ